MAKSTPSEPSSSSELRLPMPAFQAQTHSMPPWRLTICRRLGVALSCLGSLLLCGCSASKPALSATPTAHAHGNAPANTSSSLPVAKAMRVDSSRLAGSANTKTDSLLRAGDQAFLAGRYDQALNAYQTAQQQSPDLPAPGVGVVRTRLAINNVPEGVNAAPENATALAAIVQLQKISAQHPGYYVGWLELGRVHLILGQAKPAREALRKANDLQPNDPEVASSLGIALLLSGDAAGALPLMQKAAQLDPNTASRHANLATVQLQTQHLSAAIRSYQRAAQLQPDSPQVQTSLGTALLQAGDLAKALQHLRQALKLDPQRATSHNNLGFAFLLAKRCNQAHVRFEQAIKLDPKLGSAWINSAICHAKEKNLAAARKAIDRALQLDAEDPRALQVDTELRQLENRASAQPKSPKP
jgi:Flp pilus assembly protein TadD